jgi:hypothetical protein
MAKRTFTRGEIEWETRFYSGCGVGKIVEMLEQLLKENDELKATLKETQEKAEMWRETARKSLEK